MNNWASVRSRLSFLARILLNPLCHSIEGYTGVQEFYHTLVITGRYLQYMIISVTDINGFKARKLN